MKISIYLTMLLSFMFFSCREENNIDKNTEVKVVKSKFECSPYKIEDIHLEETCFISSDNSNIFTDFWNDTIVDCVLANYTKEEIRKDYYNNEKKLDNYKRIVYFALFGLSRDTAMIPVLEKYIYLHRNETLAFTYTVGEPYYFAKRSILFINGNIKDSESCYETEKEKRR